MYPGVAQLGARVVWDHQAAGLSPVAPTIWALGILLKAFSLFPPTQFLRAGESNRQPSECHAFFAWLFRPCDFRIQVCLR